LAEDQELVESEFVLLGTEVADSSVRWALPAWEPAAVRSVAGFSSNAVQGPKVSAL